MSDTSDRSSAGPFTLALRAAFVPDGEQPPPELAADFSPLRFRAALDPATGQITCDGAGLSFGGDLRAEWRPDGEQDQTKGDESGRNGNCTATRPSEESRAKVALDAP